jgi:predicted enzyme related to lactoylglutathione lyase
MPVIESYAPGTFCWADLGTPDAAAAKRFYTSLFGWSAEDRPMGPDGFYTMLRLGGHAVAALYQQEAAQHGMPPHWLSYLCVASADDVARRARELGGITLMEPFDVLDVGRIAMVQDPTGAIVALWEPRSHAGAAIVGEPGSICWNELATTDPALAGGFYSALLGWAAETYPMAVIAPSRGPVPPHWLVYFAVRDIEGQTALAQSLGGSVRVPPTDAPGVGRFAVLADPQGAEFAAIQLLTA